MTAQPVTVDATDLHVLVVAFAQVDQSFKPLLGTFPGHAEGREACGRLASALAQAASPMPPDPVSGATVGAIGTHEMLLAYEGAGFGHEEAFALTLVWVQAGAAAATQRQAADGQ